MNISKIHLQTLQQLHGAGDKWIPKKTLATALNIQPISLKYRTNTLIKLNLIQAKTIKKNLAFKITDQGRSLLKPQPQHNPLQNI
jgi:RIO-like serine/threonine protein kinase